MRKEKIITIQDRDQELTFKIKEMPAMQLERWLLGAISALASGDMEFPVTEDRAEIAGYILSNIPRAIASLDIDKAYPLLNEMLGCCYRTIDRVDEQCNPNTVDAYIMNVQTLFTLRMEAIKLNLGFLFPEAGMLSGSHEN